MKRRFSAALTQEGDWIVAQCLEMDVASQGRTAEEALANLGEALELYLEEPTASPAPEVRFVEVEMRAGAA